MDTTTVTPKHSVKLLKHPTTGVHHKGYYGVGFCHTSTNGQRRITMLRECGDLDSADLQGKKLCQKCFPSAKH